MINVLGFIFQIIATFVTSVPYIASFCTGLYSIFLTFISVIADNNDKILTVGYGASSIACVVGTLYGAVTGSYIPLCCGPIILFIVYRYHRLTYG